MSKGSWPAIRSSSSRIAASTVRANTLTVPSPTPWIPSSVSTRTRSQSFQLLPTTWGVMPVIFMGRYAYSPMVLLIIS